MSKSLITLVHEALPKITGLVNAKRILQQSTGTMTPLDAFVERGIDDINQTLTETLETILVEAGLLTPAVKERSEGGEEVDDGS